MAVRLSVWVCETRRTAISYEPPAVRGVQATLLLRSKTKAVSCQYRDSVEHVLTHRQSALGNGPQNVGGCENTHELLFLGDQSALYAGS